MKIKDLFEESGNKVLDGVTAQDLVNRDDVESRDYITAWKERINRVVPAIDFSKPENFAFYGSGEKYYENSFNHILRSYPYDGSKAERISWENSSSFLDLWVYDNLYPKQTGYVTLNPSGTDITFGGTTGWVDKNGARFISASAGAQYVLFKGGPHADPYGDYKYPAEAGLSSSIDLATKANIYDTTKSRVNNLKLDFASGVTTEFWMKKEGFFADSMNAEVIAHVAPTGTFVADGVESPSYGSYMIHMMGNSSNVGDVFARATSGSTDLFFNHGTGLATIADNKWHHYAVTMKTEDSNTVSKLYFDGVLTSTQTDSDTLNEITGAMIGAIGAMAQDMSGSGAATTQGYGGGVGWSPVASSSVDEVRFWKTERNATQIGRDWLTTVGGGTNTDDANTDLGLYFKFNEGITESDVVDKVALDYSGRISDGTINNYASTMRSTGSALVDAGYSEEKDPCVYINHPTFIANKTEYKNKGKVYDYNNLAAIKNLIPDWIMQEEDRNGSTNTQDFIQVVAYYFDELQAQIKGLREIKSVEYVSGSSFSGTLPQPSKFARQTLSHYGFVAPELFTAASFLEDLNSQSDEAVFTKKLEDIRNFVYQNIYKNLQIIYKTKGTERSINNLLRCVGIDQDLVKLNVYAFDQTYKLTSNYKVDSSRTKAVDFNHVDRFGGTVYGYPSSSVSADSSYITASATPTSARGFSEQALGYTFVSEVVFPKKSRRSSKGYWYDGYPYLSSSIFGAHRPIEGTDDSVMTWATSDYGSFQLYAVRDEIDSRNAFIQLNAPQLILGGEAALTSSVINEIYSDQHWVIAYRLKPINYPQRDFMSGSAYDSNPTTYGEYSIYGATAEYDTIDNSFEVTGGVINATNWPRLTNYPKRMYAGAHRTNFNGDLLTRSDVKILSTRVYYDYLDNETLNQFARDVNNIGNKNSSFNINQFKATASLNAYDIPQLDSCVLNWSFNINTGSDASGQFMVLDESSGSSDLTSRFGWYGGVRYANHTARGDKFPVSSRNVIDVDYISNAKQQLPGVVNSSDMVQVRNRQDDLLFEKDSRPVDYYFSLEKSPNAVVSEEIMKLFAGMAEFNNLIGQPYQRYRPEYKQLKYMRRRVFERFEEVAEVEKFFNYYKWFDSAIVKFVQNLVPATAKFSNKVSNVIESHILERSKYWNKLPTLEEKLSIPEGVIKGYDELNYNWKFGHAPITPNQGTNQDEECFWWKNRAERTDALASSDANVNSDKQTILDVITTDVSASGITLRTIGGADYQGRTYIERALAKHSKYSIDNFIKPDSVHITSPNKKESFWYPRLRKVTDDDYIEIRQNSFVSATICNDTYKPEELKKTKYFFDVYGASTPGAVGPLLDIKGENAVPFTLFSGSASKGGYEDFVANWGMRTGLEINNLHEDIIAKNFGIEAVLQGPFTEKWVGGHPYRHTPLNAMSGGSLDTSTTRAEGFYLSGGVHTDGYGGASIRTELPGEVGQGADPRSVLTRYPVAKRPVNIANIHLTGTGKNVTQLGNFEKRYQYFQTVGRDVQKSYLREFPDGLGSPNNGLYTDPTALGESVELPDGSTKPVPEIKLNVPINWAFNLEKNGGADGVPYPATRPGPLSDIHNRLAKVPSSTARDANRRGPGMARSLIDLTGSATNQTIFADRFSAPGGYEVMSRGFLDPETETYSVYNAMPWRNATVRKELDAKSSAFSAQFGFQGRKHLTGNISALVDGIDEYGGYWTSATDLATAMTLPEGPPYFPGQGTVGRASFHKVHRNPTYRMESSTVTGSAFDNFFVSHPIPTSDRQYAWITASLNTHALGASAPLGYAQWNGTTSSAEAITFLSASDWGSFIIVSSGKRAFGGPDSYRPATIDHSQRVPTDFVGINSNIYEPLTSSTNTLGYPAGTALAAATDGAATKPISYVNQAGSHAFISTLLTTPVGVSSEDAPAFNSLMLHRNGPYGYPTWKQIRTGEHPLAKYQKYNNIISTTYDKQFLMPIIGLAPTYIKKEVLEQVTEPPLMLNRPVIHALSVIDTNGNPKGTSLRYPLQNELTEFSNATLNKRLGLIMKKLPLTLYRDITKTYTAGITSPVQSFEGIIISQPVFPKQENMYLSGTRGRLNFNVDFWRNGRAQRTQTTSTNDAGVTVENTSMWSLDARENISGTGYPDASFVGGSRPTGGYGQLQNPGAVFHNGDYGNITASAMWSCPTAEFLYGGTVPGKTSGFTVVFAGDTDYEVGPQSGLPNRPFYQSYADYADVMRRYGKDYSIVPEFRISEHMDYYLADSLAPGDFLQKFPGEQDIKLSLTGASIADSSVDNFYKTYSNSDFLKMFEIVKSDHAQVGKPTTLQLRCKALMKFLPYDGFFPMQRAAQMATLFSQSYGSSISYYGTGSREQNATIGETGGDFRVALTPFFAPGLLNNTLKSGIAVDFPVMTSSADAQHHGYTVFEKTGSVAPSLYSRSQPRINSDFGKRLPFEALLSPEIQLNEMFIDMWTHPSASLEASASLGAPADLRYKLGIHNFLAESIDFFLPDGKMTSFVSKTNDKVSIGVVPQAHNITTEAPVKEYRMRIALYNGKIQNRRQMYEYVNSIGNVVGQFKALMTGSYDIDSGTKLINYARIPVKKGSQGAGGTYTADYSQRPLLNENSGLGDNLVLGYGSAYGPPVAAGNSYYYLRQEDSLEGPEHSPFTPPYFDGFAEMEYIFKHDWAGGNIDFQDFIDKTNVKYYRTCTGGRTEILFDDYFYQDSYGDTYNNSPSWRNAMQLSASITTPFQLVLEPHVVFDDLGNPKEVKGENAKQRLIIEPKFECPILDFSEASKILPPDGSGSIATGLGHQYGQIPKGKGVYLQIQDLSAAEITARGGEPQATGSLRELLGFSDAPQRLGEVNRSTVLREAIVAIPFIKTRNGKTQFFPVDKTAVSAEIITVQNYTGEDQGKDAPIKEVVLGGGGNSVQNMVRKMSRYVIPPRFDFFTNIDKVNDGQPFAMYIFEFEHFLDQKDILDIWQNLAPESLMKIKPPRFSNATISHPFLTSELLSGYQSGIRWLVFKVKQKAKTNYFAKTSDSLDDQKFRFNFNIGNQGSSKEEIPQYSYNWPYDFFSMVELAQLEATVSVTGQGAVAAEVFPAKPRDRGSRDGGEGRAIGTAPKERRVLGGGRGGARRGGARGGGARGGGSR